MRRLRQDGLWRAARDVPFLVLCAAVVLSLIRSVGQPGMDVTIGGTDVRLVPADAALVVLGVLCIVRLLGRGSLPRPARAVTLAALAFSTWLLVSAIASGFGAVVGAVKLLEYGLLGLGAVLFVRRRAQLWLLVGLLVAISAAAAAIGVLQFFDLPPYGGNPGKREPSFLGEHDFAALATMSLSLGLAALYTRRHRLRVLPGIAIVAGVIGVVLGAALASLVGLYLAVGAILALALVRRAVARRALGVTALVLLVTTAGVLSLRSGDLGSVARWVGVEQHEEQAGAYAGSWSQRLIYVYIGGRMFLASPIVGTGWYGEIPPSEYREFLPDAYARFPGQPRSYFPPADGEFTPQQTYDQVLYELGAIGAALFLVLGVVSTRTAWRVGRIWPREDVDEVASYLPLSWLLALAGGLAGAALFGGIPFAAIFWLTLGIVALAPSLVPAQAVVPPLRTEPPRVAAAVR
jgi:hypothetical protein